VQILLHEMRNTRPAMHRHAPKRPVRWFRLFDARLHFASHNFPLMPQTPPFRLARSFNVQAFVLIPDNTNGSSALTIL
jgi:hypothetical protein